MENFPTVYEYYTAGGIQSGLNADQRYFTLNGKKITLYSGAMHYFRTPKQLWRDRLRKMRAAGLNAVETYVAWNLHEPTPGQFDFGDGGTDMQDFLDIKRFLKTAQEEDLLAILRPGPYICAEWEFAGFPSWLLREKDIKFRTSDPAYMEPVERFFNNLLPILAALQFINGGPIVMFALENEYGSTSSRKFTPDKQYLEQLRNIYLENNITELIVTADAVNLAAPGTILKYFLFTANFMSGATATFDILEQIQPGRHKMAMEYYPGWFDHWSEKHHTTSAPALIETLENIISYPGSFNIYMFLGGTNFGFMNGANLDNGNTDNSGFQPDTTSYDYDAPLTEAGDYTLKYELIKTFLEKNASPKTKVPDKPKVTARIAFPSVSMVEHISIKDLLDSNQVTKLEYEKPRPMSLLDINDNSGQSYGYIVYRKENMDLKANAALTISGHVCDTVMVLVNGKLISPPLKTSKGLDNFGFWRRNNAHITLTDKALTEATLDLVVENWGRVNYGHPYQYYQFKGIWQGDILIDDLVVNEWQHIPLEFKKSWTSSLQGWMEVKNVIGPGLYRGYMNVENPEDTYLDMRQWTKGIVTVNDFVLGKYSRIGPQQALYLPAPLLRKGPNKIVVFEHYEPYNFVLFAENQIWETL